MTGFQQYFRQMELILHSRSEETTFVKIIVLASFHSLDYK